MFPGAVDNRPAHDFLAQIPVEGFATLRVQVPVALRGHHDQALIPAIDYFAADRPLEFLRVGKDKGALAVLGPQGGAGLVKVLHLRSRFVDQQAEVGIQPAQHFQVITQAQAEDRGQAGRPVGKIAGGPVQPAGGFGPGVVAAVEGPALEDEAGAFGAVHNLGYAVGGAEARGPVRRVQGGRFVIHFLSPFAVIFFPAAPEAGRGEFSGGFN